MDLIISLMEYAQSRYSLVLLMVFLLTFTKSCAVISLLIPGTSGLLLFGTLASASVGHLHRIRWLNAERLARGQLFLRRHGAWAVFFSRFLSPLRATVPLVTGASGTSLWQFQLANVSSGLLWPLVLLTPGALSLNF